MAKVPLIYNGVPLIKNGQPAVGTSCEGCCQGAWCAWGVYFDGAGPTPGGSPLISGDGAAPHGGVFTNTQKWYLVKCGRPTGSNFFVNSFPDWAVELPALGALSQSASYDWETPVWSTNNSVYVFSTEEPRVVKVSIAGESVSWVSDAIPSGSGTGPYSGTDDSVNTGSAIISGGAVVVDTLLHASEGSYWKVFLCQGPPNPDGFGCIGDPFWFVTFFYVDDSDGYTVSKWSDLFPVNGNIEHLDAGVSAPGIDQQAFSVAPIPCESTAPDCAGDFDTFKVAAFSVDPTDFAPTLENSVSTLGDFLWQQSIVEGPLSGLDAYLHYKQAVQDLVFPGGQYFEWEMHGGPNLIFRNGVDSNSVAWNDGEPLWGAHRTARGGTIIVTPNEVDSSANLHAYIDGGAGVEINDGTNTHPGVGAYGIMYIDSNETEIYFQNITLTGFPLVLDYDGNVVDGCLPIPPFGGLHAFIRFGTGLIKLNADRIEPAIGV